MKQIAIIIVILVVLGGGILLYQSSPNNTEALAPEVPAYETPVSSATTSDANTSPTASPTPAPGEYTMADVAKHSDSGSCWSVVNGSVYNLTAWIGQHPGGPDKIKALCGKDGSSAFNNQHGGMQKQESQLATFKIGTLIN